MINSTMRVEELLRRSAAQWGNRPAIIGQETVTSYSELWETSCEIASALRGAGVPPRSIVGIALLEGRDFLATLFGILSAQCVAIPISPQLSLAEQSRVIRETSVTWTIHNSPPTSASCESYSLTIARLPQLSLRKELSQATVDPLSRFPDAAVIRHTSGTTAHSKGVVLSHRNVLERTDASMTLIDVCDGDAVLAPLPLAYHFVASALSFLRAGAVILDCAALSPSQILGLGEAHNATMIYGSPIQHELLSRTATTGALRSLRRAISTSAVLPAATAELFKARFGLRLTQVYGVIEVGLPLWNNNLKDSPVLLGRCLPPYEYRVVRGDGEPVLLGEVGELLVRGPGVFAGYLHGEGAGVEHAPNAWFHTGDLVAQDENGAIAYRGRKKSVINSAGNKIFPEEVEEVLRQRPEIRDIRVIAEPHALLGSLVVAEVVLREGAAPDIEEWRTMCYSELSGFKVPKEFRVVDNLPTTGSGKVVRHSSPVEKAAA